MNRNEPMLADKTRAWQNLAIKSIEADACRFADTELIRLELPGFPGITLYLKDESLHPSGSLKHRMARSLFLYALCNNCIGPGTTIVEASSGSTAVSEAYFARLIGSPFVAVVPASTAQPKIDAIRAFGGEVHRVACPSRVYQTAQDLAKSRGGHFVDQFTFAERAIDWRGNSNVAQSIFSELALECRSTPTWIVCGAGTGGTSATIGRYLRYTRRATRLCVADPTLSVFHRNYADLSTAAGFCASRAE